MELWIGGTKFANFPGTRINTNWTNLDFESITVVEVDSNGNYLKATEVFFFDGC